MKIRHFTEVKRHWEFPLLSNIFERKTQNGDKTKVRGKGKTNATGYQNNDEWTAILISIFDEESDKNALQKQQKKVLRRRLHNLL